MKFDLMGQYIPGNSCVHSCEPRAKLTVFLLMVVMIALADSLPGYVLAVLLLGMIMAFSDTSAAFAAGSIRRIGPFCLTLIIVNSFFFKSEDPVFSLWIINFSVEGVAQGISVSLRLIMILILSNVFTMTTSPMEIMNALQVLMKPLALVRLPADELAMILSVAIQFIPVLIEETDTIKKAQIARGARFESSRLIERGRALLPLLIPIFVSAFRRADELSIAMISRGYRGARYQTGKNNPPMDARSVSVMIAGCALTVIQIVIRVKW